MSNIMITQRCNLRCPYCFADEFVGKQNTDISRENFSKALDFALSDSEGAVGLIGGEPLIHNDMEYFLEQIIYDNRIQSCTVYTNGIYADKFVRQFTNPKFRLLINCNSPTDIGENNFKKTSDNIDLLCDKYYMSDRITLGINMYKENFEYNYILKILEKHRFPYLRTSVSVPDMNVYGDNSPLPYFYKMKPYVLNFFNLLLDMGVMPFYDCNAFPHCIFTSDELDMLRKKCEKCGYEDQNLFSETVTCSPVADILPDLSIIRCFALSEHKKAKISDFNNISEARAYFKNCFDTLGYHVCSDEKCRDCFERKTMKCSGGCYAFKADKILKYTESILV